MATTLLPAASAAETWPRKMASGKFQGAMQTQAPRPSSRMHVALAGRPGQLDRLQVPARLGGVIAAEIDRLAHLGERVGDRLLRLLDRDPHQHVAVALEQVGEPLEGGGALLDAARRPFVEARQRAGHQLVGGRARRSA